jgi:formylglycine-generating enzyme
MAAITQTFEIFTEFESLPHAFKMIPIEGGNFTMGETKKQHQVADFFMAETPVTQCLWQHIMGNNPAHFIGKKRPVEKVSWFDALSENTGKTPYYYHDAAFSIPFGKENKQYAILKNLDAKTPIYFQQKANGYRLPSEAEWEYAARGGNKNHDFEFSGSDNLDLVGWYNGNSNQETKPVGLKTPNELGIFDMSGNVWEWCEDWYDDYSKKPKNGTAFIEKGASRVLRGGGWFGNAQNCSTADCNGRTPEFRFYLIGFRLCSFLQSVG